MLEPGMPPGSGRESRKALQQACAVAHGCGSGMSMLELVALVVERGLPSQEERERMLAAKLGEVIAEEIAGGNTT